MNLDKIDTVALRSKLHTRRHMRLYDGLYVFSMLLMLNAVAVIVKSVLHKNLLFMQNGWWQFFFIQLLCSVIGLIYSSIQINKQQKRLYYIQQKEILDKLPD